MLQGVGSRIAAHALPTLQQAFAPCADAQPELLDQVLPRLLNASGRLHWRVARLGWLQGGESLEDFPDVLSQFADTSWPTERTAEGGSCWQRLTHATLFYQAWRELLRAQSFGAGDQTGEWWQPLTNAVVVFGDYLRNKDLGEPLLVPERQFAHMFRSAHALLSGVHVSPCTCQLNWASKLLDSAEVFARGFRWDRVRPGQGTAADPESDAFLRMIMWGGRSCVWDLPAGLVQWAVPPDKLVQPDADQLRSPYACLPMRILAALVCGQAAMLHGQLQWANEQFQVAMLNLIFVVDCFDGMPGARVLDILAYFGRLDPSVAPSAAKSSGSAAAWRDPSIAGVDEASRQLRRSRSLILELQDSAARLPPLCLDGQGSISLRISGGPGGSSRPLHLYDRSALWNLVPVRPVLPAAAKLDDSIAVILRVDAASWNNLGHGLSFIVPIVVAAFADAFAQGGLERVWQQRDRHRVYLYFPRLADQTVLEQRQRGQVLAWLELLSPHEPIFFPVPTQPPVEPGLVPPPLRMADGNTTRCHQAGRWGGPIPQTSFRKSYYDLFATLVTNLPAWQVPRTELLHRAWGQEGLAPGDDPCMQTASRCIRVLVVERGSLAKHKRRVANLDKALVAVKSKYSVSTVRVAVLQMELFTLAEEVVLATLADVLIGSMGSAMWWSIFMPENSALLWLLPKLSSREKQLSDPIGVLEPTVDGVGHLEFGPYRTLRHWTLHGVEPPAGTALDMNLETENQHENQFDVLEKDVFIDPGLFVRAFDGIVADLQRRLARNSTRSSWLK